MSDSEALKLTIMTIQISVSKFHDANMRELKDCQKVRKIAYLYLGSYKEGNKVWYQHHDGNAWCGVALVICQ